MEPNQTKIVIAKCPYCIEHNVKKELSIAETENTGLMVRFYCEKTGEYFEAEVKNVKLDPDEEVYRE